MRTPTRIVLALIVLAVFALVAAGCDSYNNERGRGDAPVGQVSSEPRTIMEFPDWFANVAVACIPSHPGKAVAVTTRDAAPVVFDSPACQGGAR